MELPKKQKVYNFTKLSATKLFSGIVCDFAASVFYIMAVVAIVQLHGVVISAHDTIDYVRQKSTSVSKVVLTTCAYAWGEMTGDFSLIKEINEKEKKEAEN